MLGPISTSGIPLVTGCPFEKDLFTIPLQVCVVSLFPTHWSKLQRIYLSHHMSRESYFAIEGDQVFQSQSALGESMQDFPDHLFHLTCHSPPEDSFSSFPRDRNKTDGPKNSRILI